MNKLVLSILLFICSVSLLAQISPGELSEAHKHLEGVSNCTECHAVGDKVTNQKCLDCHKEVQTLVTQKRGYHNSKEVTSKKCVECHNEHHGRKFDLFRLDEKTFDHELADYTLKGEHKRIDCRDCHKPDFIANNEIKKLKDTYLGLEEECLACHKNYHQKTIEKDCIECHNFEKWDPAELFNHEETKFKLKGAHKEVDCVKCHKKTIKNGEDYQEFSNLKFNLCTDCHEDPHNNHFGSNCTDCHNNSSWVNLNKGFKFDHNKTDFPLRGLHVELDCEKCHTSDKNTNPVAHNQCKDCHEDYHKKEFTNKITTIDCKDCHTIELPFTSTIYGLKQHLESDFKLEGAHIATPCFACHVSEDEWTFRNIGESCVDCHKNIHKEVLDEKYYPKEDCKQCHNSDTWTNVTFDHEKTEWPLKGEHNNAKCRNCHFEDNEENDLFTQKFKPINKNCVQCHDNGHGKQFEHNGGTDCATCHTAAKNWRVEKFNHNETKFPLDGKHKDVACKLCHKLKLFEDNIERIEYKIKKFECIDCHS